MPRVVFTRNLQRHVPSPAVDVPGSSVRQVLEAAFARNHRVRGYVLDDQGALRKHMVVFIDGQQIRDRIALSDPVGPDSEVYIMQALSGGT